MNAQPIIMPTQYNNRILRFVPQDEKPKKPPKELKYKKDGTLKNIKSNKQKGKKSEVYPFQVEDAKKMTVYFRDNEMWQCYLIFIIGINMARRVGDTLSLTWEHFFNPVNGKFREDTMEIEEDKTDKLACPHINSSCRSAIKLYLEKTGVDPAENHYKNPVFIQTEGNFKGRVLTADAYRKALKKAAETVGIEYNVGTHSTRKTFGMLSRLIHPGDPNSMEMLQMIFNHSDVKTTNSYIGLTKQKMTQYYNDIGDFSDKYITGDETYIGSSDVPIISLDTNDLRDVIAAAYKAGQENSGNVDPMVHVDAINNLMSMIEQFAK